MLRAVMTLAILAFSANVTAQDFSLGVLMLKVPKPDEPVTLWLVTKNETKVSRVVCRHSFSFLLTPRPRFARHDAAPSFSKGPDSVSACGDGEPFWLLLPGETRFDPYDVQLKPDPNYYVPDHYLTVQTTLTDQSDSWSQTLEWKGILPDTFRDSRYFYPSRLRPDVSMKVAFVDKPTTLGKATLWMAIKNEGRERRLLCQGAWSYELLRANPNDPSGDNQATGTFDTPCSSPPWILLAGQTRFGWIEVTVPPENDFGIDIHSDIVDPVNGMKRSLTWKGRASEALRAGRKLRMP